MSKSQAMYKVDKIVGEQEKDGRVLYKVHWANFSVAHDTWEPLENLGQCQELIDEYHDKQAAINRRKSLRSHSSEPQQRGTRRTTTRETHSVTAFSSDEEEGEEVTASARKPPAKRRMTKSPAKTKSPVKAKKPPAGRNKKAAADSDIAKQPQAVGQSTSYNFRATQSRINISGGVAAFSSDEDTATGPVGARMTLIESRFKKRLAEISFVPKAHTSTPNTKTSMQSSSVTTRSNTRVKTSLKVDVRKEQSLTSTDSRAEPSICKEADDAESFPAEAPPPLASSAAQEQPPQSKDAPPSLSPATDTDEEEEEERGNARAEGYPAWMRLGLKELVLAGVVGAVAVGGYVCYYTDSCSFQ